MSEIMNSATILEGPPTELICICEEWEVDTQARIDIV